MNAFIEMRKSYFENPCSVSFPEFYFKNFPSFIEEEGFKSLLEKMACISELNTEEVISEDRLIYHLKCLGENVYLDRYIVDLIILHKEFIIKGEINQTLINMLADPENTNRKLGHLLDICIECDCPLLKGESLQTVFRQNEYELNGLSMLIEYMTHFRIDDFTHIFLKHMHEYPETIKTQIVDLLVVCISEKEVIKELISLNSSLESDACKYLDYLTFITGDDASVKSAEAGIVVVQTAFQGDPTMHGGKGQSRGLDTLLRTLGNELIKQHEVSKVITLFINNDWRDNKPLISVVNDFHWIVRLPIFLDTEDQHAFMSKERSIKRAAVKFMKNWNIKPDVVHVRYLDNATRSMAFLCKEMKANLVFTLTPDPHRSMVDHTGNLVYLQTEEALKRLNKIKVGDELLAIADGVVGIGGDEVNGELEQYFPQLKNVPHKFPFKMIGEGINIANLPPDFELWEVLEVNAIQYRIDSLYKSKPVILNVGRLNSQKGQERLIKAWGESQLWKVYNLIIIGGNREYPDDEEIKMMNYFEDYMQANKKLNGRFAHVQALPNEMIRGIERKIMQKPAEYSNIYLCSSKKEEFGISILEALSEAFLVFAPLEGGVKSYIKHGYNGFLVDTSSWTALRKDVERILYHSHLSKDDFTKIRIRGQRTVLEKFSIEVIAKEMLAFYLSLKERTPNHAL